LVVAANFDESSSPAAITPPGADALARALTDDGARKIPADTGIA
jgi:hypothetical protein